MLYTYFNNYVLTPSVTAVKTYVLEPAYRFIEGKMIAAATKATSAGVTKAVAKPLLNIQADDAVQIAQDNRPAFERFQDKAITFVKGEVYENVTDAGLKVINHVTPIHAPILYTAPRALKLAITQPANALNPAKEVIFGAVSHGVGRLVQEQVDSYFPLAAPYGGYVGYGIASSATKIGLNQIPMGCRNAP